MPRKILRRISRIFNHKDDINIADTQTEPATTVHYNNSVPVLLQRAPSSKLLIDDFMDVSTIDYHYSDIQQEESFMKAQRQSWFSSISRLKTLKKNSNKKRKSSECWFVTQQQGELEIPDQQQGASPLSIASSVCSTHNNRHHLSSSSASSWLPIEEDDDNTSTARTSLDSQVIKSDYFLVAQPPPPPKQASCISLAENVKHILGDAIYLADQELDI
ncbi:hypothetical protein BDF21DRAFT_415090 [Thamnidium elegans]|uniref:Uncharacterized protein n=1 Tax=Thamnidium elegans TaxID=101142 RepID=A0A8H7SFQ5_9FUNG|nr:hypothetical protein INT48_002757 [Thamnidium elegans]KAI8085402.1 hypothetical protein BDF21DRAFT_415090 [Thamnidium elegans]